MIREICKDKAFLAQKAESAAADDLCTAQDLLDTLIAHKDGCVGMAANMIGVNKRIIAFECGGRPVWVKEQCVMCLCCLHHCPKFSIQYGNKTLRHGQYVHPPYKG